MVTDPEHSLFRRLCQKLKKNKTPRQWIKNTIKTNYLTLFDCVSYELILTKFAFPQQNKWC